MSERLDWTRINPKAYEGFRNAAASAATIDPRLRELLEVRVSQMNGCAFCLDMHARQARRAGETQQRLDCLAGWREMPTFDARERAALEWAEALTRIADTHAPDEAYEALRPHFSDEEIVALTVVVTMINSWNRMQIAMRRNPPGT